MIDFEKYMIPAEEATTFKEFLAETAFLALACAVIGIPVHIANKKKEEAEALLKKKQDEEKSKKLKDLRVQIKSKYGYDPDGQYSDSWKSFTKKIYVKIINDIRKAVVAYNKNEQFIESVRKNYLNWLKKSSIDQLEDWELEEYNMIKKGFLTCDEEEPLVFDDKYKIAEAYVSIVPTQDLAIVCSAHWDITKVLETKYADLVAYGLIDFTNGDGDEGCIYLHFASK